MAAARASLGFMLRHPAHWIALGFGSGLAPFAPGTFGTLWAWAVFVLLNRWLDAAQWALVLGAGLALGLWACTLTARHLDVADSAPVVWDEVIAFWIILWFLLPAGFWLQLLAFVVFRLLDALKPGPVGWADRRFKRAGDEPIGLRHGFGILFDDLVAAFGTLLLLALALRLAAW